MLESKLRADKIYLGTLKLIFFTNSISILIAYFWLHEPSYIFVPLGALFLEAFSFLFYLKKHKKAAFHLLISTHLLFFAFTFPYLGNYKAMSLAFPLGIVCSNLLFENRNANIFYACLSSFTGSIFIYFGMQQQGNVDIAALGAELFYMIAISFTYYVMSQIYLENTLLYKKTVANREESIRQKNEQLEKYIASNLELENFAYLASHDLRTPLQNVISFSKLLNRKLKPKMTAQEQQFFSYIMAGSQRMQETIEALLRFSLVNNNDIQIAQTDISQVIIDTKNDLQQLITQSQCIINVSEMPKAGFVDAHLFRELILNLVSNAIKFTPKDKIPKIDIQCQETAREYLFSVADNGIGIPDESKEMIFGIFKRLHLQKEYEGTGIGLALCRKIVEKHDGKIWVENQQNEGSIFYFTIKKMNLQQPNS